MISKKRYWGLALPIWECDECGNFEVIGSEEELKSKAVEGWENFEGHTPHRPRIDMVKITCEKCGAKVSRIMDVGNPWLDAGIVSYSTLNYRNDRKFWREWFPADLICESLPGQFRNWFYSMLVMSTILEGCTSFRACFGHGNVLGEDGREMHKSWGNAIWFDEAVETIGADVMRWMFCTNRPEANLLFGYKRADEVKRRFLIPLWNVYNFFVTYASLDKWTPKDSTDEYSLLDRWILSNLQVLVKDVTRYMDDYDPFNAAKSIENFVDELSVWYIRRSRRRFWKSEADLDKKAAYTTLYKCLTTLTRILAPFAPFITEEIYQNVVRAVDPEAHESVHHNDWPAIDESLINEELMEDMDGAIKVCSLGRSARSKAGIKLRQPLSEVKIVADESMLKRLQRLQELIKDELNVKELDLTSQREGIVDYAVRLLPEVLGKKYGSLFPRVRSAVARLDANAVAPRLLDGRSIEVEVEGRAVEILSDEVEVSTVPKEGYSVAEEEEMIVGVNVVLTEQLRKEGFARDIVRRIQNQRKEAGFNIADEIETYYKAGPKLIEVFTDHGDYIAAETLSTVIEKAEPPKDAHVSEYNIEGETIRIGLIRAVAS